MKSQSDPAAGCIPFRAAKLKKRWLLLPAVCVLALILLLSPAGKAFAQTIPGVSPGPAAAVAPEPVIQSVLNLVDTDLVRSIDGDLSGAWPVNIGGSPYQFTNRYCLNPTSMEKATQYAYERFTSFGLDTSFQTYSFFGTTLRNVVAEQPGLVHPDQIFLITAHLDSISSSSYSNPDAPAPGADDNGSGSTGVLIAARLLSQFDFDYTLRYVLFTGEERGLGGSFAYASDSFTNGEDILGVLNLDMIAYNSDSQPVIDLHTRPSDLKDLALANMFVDVTGAYGLNLAPEIFNDGMGRSDHESFWKFGFPAILAIEDESDFTPYYHTVNDTLSSLNLGFFTEFVRAAVGSLAHLGGLQVGYADGIVRDVSSDQPLPDSIVSVQYNPDLLFSTTSDAGGDFSLSLPPGSYTIQATAPNHVPIDLPGVEIQTGQATSLDIALESCQQLDGVDLSFTPAEPLVGQTVTLTASLTAPAPSPVDYTWDFGDGSPAVSGQGLTSLSHIFTPQAHDQVYQVSVSAFNHCYIPVESRRQIEIAAYKVFFPLSASSASTAEHVGVVNRAARLR